MSSNRRKARLIASLTFAVLATGIYVPASTQAGPISDMIARRRQERALKMQTGKSPYAIKPFHEMSAKTANLADRFKQRFSLRRGTSSGMNMDSSVIKTSR